MNRSVKYQVMPPLSPDEYQDLYEDIKTNGVLVPIIEDEDGVIIDGHHRAKIASELNVPCPVEIAEGKSEATKRGMAFTLNLKRRHLNREQRRHLIAESLKKDPQLSNREHARRTGASPSTVQPIREELEESVQIGHFSNRIDPRTGNATQPTSQPVRRTEPERQPAEPSTTDIMSQDDLDELNAPEPPRIPDPVTPPPATTEEDKRPTQSDEHQLMVKLMAHLNKASQEIREATFTASKLTTWPGAPLSDDLREQLDELDEALKSGGFDGEMERLINGENDGQL